MPKSELKVERRDGRPLMPLAAVAEHLSLGLRTVKALVATGELKVVRVSKRRLAVDPRDLDHFVASRRE